MTAWPDELAAMPAEDVAGLMANMSDAEVEVLAHDWKAWRRPAQEPPSVPWRFWLIMTGRGWGKTRTGAEWIRDSATSGLFRHVNIIGATVDDARDIMIEGESGILEICPKSERPVYRKQLRRMDWPNGCKTLVFSADKPDRLRGKQHQRIWADELAAWGKDGDAWTQVKLGLRLPPDPRCVVTTTPKPLKFLKRLVADAATVITGGTTYDNRANLDVGFFRDIITEYEGTETGRQELEGHLLDEAQGALWRRSWIDKNRVAQLPETIVRVCVGVDPSGGGAGTECGIVGAALGELGPGETPEARFLSAQKYIVADWSEVLPAAEWGLKVWRLALEIGADSVVAEKNFGGDMVGANLAAVEAASPEFQGVELPPFRLVAASRGKAVRAEPWAGQAQQGRLHHVGEHDDLEDEECTWIPGEKSPNRIDAEVWALEGLRGFGDWYLGTAGR